MNEGEDPLPDANNDSSGEEGEANLRKKLKPKKKKTGKLKDESMKSASSSEMPPVKKTPSKARRAKTMNDAESSGKVYARRKSNGTDQTSSSTRSKDSSLSLISKTSSRRGSKTLGDENASAFSGGSGDSRSIANRKSGRNRSPARIGSNDDNAISSKKKSAFAGRRKSGGGGSQHHQQHQQGFDPEASASMWDMPSFGAGVESSNKQDAAGFASAFDGGAGGGGGFGGDFNDDFFSSDAFDAKASTKATETSAASFFDTQGAFGGTQDSVFGGSNAFGASASSQRERLDASPHKDPPRRKIGKLSLVKKTVFSHNFACQPVKNPVNGNIIFCTSRDGEMYIQEVDPMRQFVQVLSSPILTPELHRKVTAKYSRSAYGIDNVLKLCVGMHESHGQPRVRVAAVIDLLVLDSKHILRAIAVWQWGYGSARPVSLQFLLSPPSGTDYAYDPESILSADNVFFCAGASAKGPCVFMCKPSVRESWSANFLAPSGKIVSMAVTSGAKRKHPFLAVGMADGSVSVWTYAAALKQVASKKNEPFRRLLYPLCRLDALWVLNSVQPTSFAEEKRQKTTDKADAGMCTNLEWLPPQPELSSLLLLAAGFQGGFAVFHVALPYVSDDSSKGKYIPVPLPTQSTQLASTPQIRPFAAVRFTSQLQDVSISWLDLSPHNNPCLALLLQGRSQDEEPGRVVLGAINTVEYRKGGKSKENLASFRTLATAAWRSKGKGFPQGLLSCSGLDAVACHVGDGIVALHPSFSSSAHDPAVQSLRYPVSSNPPGVDSTGEICFTDAASDKEGILHVYSINQCDLIKNEQHPNLLNWSRPARRHWLCRTLCGDRKETQAKEEAKEASQFGDDDDIAVGGSISDVVCELEGKALSGLVPFRVIRCPGSTAVAVMFRPALGHSAQGIVAGFSMDCVAIALIDTEKRGETNIEVIEGRDLTFLPTDDTTVRALVLSRDGCSLCLHQKTSSGCWSAGASCRPILGVECDDSYVEAQRVFLVSSEANCGLAVVGKRYSDDRSCIVCGPMEKRDQIGSDSFKKILPELAPSQPCLWLNEGEEVVSLICLPHSLAATQKLAVATSSRVLILDLNMEVVGKSKVLVASGALAPLGSSSVSFCSADAKIRYVSSLRGKLGYGSLATLPVPRFGYGTSLLLALRPDRVLCINWHSGSTLVEHKEDPDSFLLPNAVTKPAVLLEPLVANAICEGAKNGGGTTVLRGVIERFGRKVASITHGEDEGVGNRGTGITPRVFELLNMHGLKQAASWLLTGGVQFERSTNSKILPPFMPLGAKREAALNSDAFLHLVANGDQYLSEYIQSPDHNMSSSLPRPGDPTPYLCREWGQEALANGEAADALKMLDIAGTESTESMLLQLSLLLQIKSGDNTDVLKSLSGYDEGALSRSSGLPTATASLAALCVSKKVNGPNHQMSEDHLKRWMKPLAPSLQRGTHFGRARQRLLGERELEAVGGTQIKTNTDPQWSTPCNESRHIWNEGPNKEKENLLLLDNAQDWLGRRRPTLLGKAGVEAAEERGEGALANILDMQENEEENSDKDDDDESKTKGWDEGVGEGRQDEENLSGYYRFWEGEDDESPWSTEGFSDLSRFQSKATVVGQEGAVTLQPTTSSVDEGEPGKVKPLYDVVFEAAGDQEPSGLAITANRGNSLDVGVLHKDRPSRQRCTVELWYYLPPASMVKSEIILVRRTLGDDADDFSKVCIASDKRAVLWEVVLMKSGELEVRTCGGSVIKSSKKRSDSSDTEESERKDVAVFERWNHVCVVLSSRDTNKLSDCSMSLFMMGASVASSDISMLPPGLKEGDLAAKADALLEKSYLVFGCNHAVNFRLTEIRIWACERSEDDIKMMMREYLDAAEARKKKFRVKIGKNKKGAGGVGMLAPPKAGGLLAPPKAGGLAPPKGGLSPPKAGGLAPPKGSKGAMLAPPKGSANRPGLLAPPKAGLLSPPKDRNEPDSSGFPAIETSASEQPASISDTGFEATFGSFGSTQDIAESPSPNTPLPATGGGDDGAWGDLAVTESATTPESPKQSLWDSAVPLSQQVRSSAAAALIRGPPATRHFGGNRGGLPDLRGTDRYGVGGIAICGSEKTIVWRDEEDPPALTYPIGASGAIVSDQLDDDEGSEFLCCFLAKDKRMVVFELNSRTVVVELQMTTKLNFWRFLPPEAGQSTLCFMLITPVGGFHWMCLDDSPRPRQVWKRGSDLQGKKVVQYEEGGSNGGTGPQMISRCGLICVTDSNGTGTLEAWIVPICGDSGAVLASSDTQGAAFCCPENIEGKPFLPHLVQVIKAGGVLDLTITSIVEPESGSVALGDLIVSEALPTADFQATHLEPPTLAMGVFPESMVCSLGNIIVVVLRNMGAMLAYEFKNNSVHLIAKEDLGHYVVDSVMRYSAIEGSAEIVMLLSDNDNHKDGRIASYFFRSFA